MKDNANLYAALAAGFDPARTALETAEGTSYSCADVDALSAQAANALRELGLEPGDRVSVLAEKSPTYLWLYLGALRAGCVFHPLNPAYSERELEFFLSDAGTSVLIADPMLAGKTAPVIDQLQRQVSCIGLSADGGGAFAGYMTGQAKSFTTVERAETDTAALLYSSGTTGTPKGIRITHGNLHANARALEAAWAFGPNDILVHALPVFHVHGLFIALNPALLAGTRLRFLPRFESGAVIEALHGATMMAGVPTYYARLLDDERFTRECCASIRVFISGSAPLSESAFHSFEARTGHRILERYGMTETGINTSNPLDGARKPGSVGPPLPGVDLRIVDADDKPCASSEVGAIQVRGDNVFPGYWELPDATSKAFDAAGWFDTGDQGFLDADGYLSIVGRSKDLVISGGLNVYPKEVEREIEALPGISEAAVFGVPHADFGEAVVAAVVTSDDVDPDLRALLDELKTRLANFKMPKHLIPLEDLPRNTMGKVQKNVLRERFRDLFEA